MTIAIKRKPEEANDISARTKVHVVDRQTSDNVTSNFCRNWFRDAKSILILGDGNLSFSLAVAESEKDIPITATVLDSECQFETRYPSNPIPELLKQHKNVELLFSIDATALPQEWLGKFHCIVMNFPHPGGKTNLKKSRQLASAIFHGVAQIMISETKFYLALAQGQAGIEQRDERDLWTSALPSHSKDSWQALYLAAEEGLLLTEVCAFPAGAFAGYRCSGYKSTARGFNNSKGSQRLLFTKSRIVKLLSEVTALSRKGKAFHQLRPYFQHDLSFLFSGDIEEGEKLVFDMLRLLTGSAVVEIVEIERLRSMCPDPYLPNRIYRLTWQVVEVAVGKRLCNDLQEQLRSEILRIIKAKNLPLVLT